MSCLRLLSFFLILLSSLQTQAQDLTFGSVSMQDTYTSAGSYQVIGSGISISNGKLLSRGTGYIQYPANSKISGSSNLVVEFSVKFSTLDDLVRVLYLKSSYHIDVRPGYVQFNIFTDRGPYTLRISNVISDLSREYRISMMVNNGELVGFIDGKMIDKTPAPGKIIPSTSPLYFAGTGDKYLVGTVDNLKIGTAAATISGPGCDCGSTNASAPCMGNSVTHTRKSDMFPTSTIQYEFQCDGGPCACGKFANQYDYWVAPKTAGGVVKIIKMSPATIGAADATLRSGWVANPSAIVASTFMDGRLGADMSATGKPLNPTATKPFSISTALVPVTTIVKSHSMLETDAKCSNALDPASILSRHCFWQAAVLTVLNKVPANAGTTILRPPMTGKEKPLLSTTLINFLGLPNLPYPVRKDGSVVIGRTWEEALDLMGPPKVEWGTSGNFTFWQYMPPLYNFSKDESGYPPRSMAGLIDSMQLLAIDGKGFEAQKKLLTIRSVQWGLDYYYMWKAKGYGPMYQSNGGHAVGRYLPTVIAAALMTGTVGTQMKSDMLRVNNGTADKCGFDISTELHYWPTTKRTIFGYYNIPGCGDYGSYLRNTNSNYVDPGFYGDNGRLEVNEKNDINEVNSCSGAYQHITVGPTQATANLIRAIPAARAIAANTLMTYTERMVTNGYYCRKDHTPSATYESAFGKCQGGVNQGEECITPKQCPGSECVGHKHQYSSWLARNMWAKYKNCYDTKSCPGMSGIK